MCDLIWTSPVICVKDLNPHEAILFNLTLNHINNKEGVSCSDENQHPTLSLKT